MMTGPIAQASAPMKCTPQVNCNTPWDCPRPLSEATIRTGEFIQKVLVGLAGDANPTADVTRAACSLFRFSYMGRCTGTWAPLGFPKESGLCSELIPSPVSHFPIDVLIILFVIMEDVVAAQTVPISIKVNIVSVSAGRNGAVGISASDKYNYLHSWQQMKRYFTAAKCFSL